MHCREVALQLDDWLDGRLSAAAQLSFQLHADACPTCRRACRRAEELHAQLRRLPAPALRADFAEQALARAVAEPAGAARPARRGTLGVALAALVVLGLGAGLAWFAFRAEPAHTVILAARQPESVRLVFNSARPLQGVTLTLTLPGNVEIVGYGGRRELSWKTDLHEGANLLRLPLVVNGPAGGELVARVSSGTSSKTFRLNIKVRGGDAAGAFPVRVVSRA
jgi:hypothetical protein